MKLQEALATHMKPERIPTGSGKSTVANPAHLNTGYYEGDPEKFEFTRQQQANYQAIKSKLARYNLKLDYIGAGISRLGNPIFVATGPGVVWYKYEAASTASAVNVIYVNGVKFKTTQFIAIPDQKLDEIINNVPDISRFVQEKDFFGLVSRVNDKSNLSAISKFIKDNKSFVIESIISNTAENPKRMTVFTKVIAKLSKLGIDVTGLEWKYIEPEIVSKIVNRYNADTTWISGKIKYYESIPEEFRSTINQKLFPEIEKAEPKLIEYFKRMILSATRVLSRDGEFKKLMTFYNNIGYQPKELSLASIFEDISLEDILTVVDKDISHIHQYTGVGYTAYSDMIRKFSILVAESPARIVDLIYQALEIKRSEIVTAVLLYTAVTSKTNLIEEFQRAPSLGLEIQWSELEAPNVVEFLSRPDTKANIIKSMLLALKASRTSQVERSIRSLQSLGISWPEFEKIEKVLDKRSINEDISEEDEELYYEAIDLMVELYDELKGGHFATAVSTLAELGRLYQEEGVYLPKARDMVYGDIQTVRKIDSIYGLLDDISDNGRREMISAIIRIPSGNQITNLISVLEDFGVEWSELDRIDSVVQTGAFDRRKLSESLDPNSMSEEDQIKFAQTDWRAIRELTNPSERVQLAAVSKFPMSVNYINSPTLKTQITALRYSGTMVHSIDQIDPRVFDDKEVVDSITKSLLYGIKSGYFDSVYSILEKLENTGRGWPSLETIKKSLNRKPISKNRELIIENLGTLSELRLGNLVGLIKQPFFNNRRTQSIGPVKDKFQYWEIGARSEITTIPVTKDLAKSLKKEYDRNIVAAAVYLDNRAVLFTITNNDNLRGRTRSNPVAYDLSAYSDDFSEAMKDVYYYRMSPTTARQEEERDYDKPWKPGEDRPTKIQYYAGTVLETQELMNILNAIESIAKKNSLSITIKLVKKDIESSKIRQQRYDITPGDILVTGEHLKVRLAKYKNAKRPTADTIQDFIKMTLNDTADIVRFAGTPYKKSTSTYEQINPFDLLRGKPFSVRYNSANPGEYYMDVTVSFRFDRETNMLVPFYARWSGEESRGEQVLDAGAYLKTKLNINTLDKKSVLFKLLEKVKAGVDYAAIESYIKLLGDMDFDWPELDKILAVIKKSSIR